jgi:WD40 repeat protein
MRIGRGSISKVMADDRMGISGSYDASIILWDLSSKVASDRLIGPHKEAIMDFEWKNSLLVSGDKAGVVAIWVPLPLGRTSTGRRW